MEKTLYDAASCCAVLTAGMTVLWKKDIVLTEAGTWKEKDTETVLSEINDKNAAADTPSVHGLLLSIVSRLKDDELKETAEGIYRGTCDWIENIHAGECHYLSEVMKQIRPMTDISYDEKIIEEMDIAGNDFSRRSHIPIIINKILVTAFYDAMHDEGDKDISVLRDMQTIAAVTFSAIDISEAGIRAAEDDREGFVDRYIGNINFPGIGDIVLSSSDAARADLGELYDIYHDLGKGSCSEGYVDQVMKVYENLADAVMKYDIPMEKRRFVEMKSRDEVSILKENREAIGSYIEGYMKDRFPEK